MNSGEYLGTHQKCQLCHVTCYKCIGPESEDCISCSSTRFFDKGSCVIRCDPGKYQRDGQCLLCHHTCLECKDEGPDRCTRCGKDKSEVERYLFKGECRESCPEGYYHSSKGTCDPCPPNCTVCTSPGHCLYCAPSYYPTDGKCAKLECGEGEVADLDHEDCVTCEEGCEKCLSVNPEHCMACLPDYYQLGSSCRKICPAGTFEEKYLKTCARCGDNCVTCDDTDCYLCEEGFLLSDGTCVNTCKEGFYSDMKQECEPCHHACRSCGGPNHDDCDTCEDDMSPMDGQCVSKSKIKCPDGTFLSGQGVCEQCRSTCKSCSGPEKDQCESCPKGIFLTNGQTCVSDCQAETYGNRTSGRCEDCSAGCSKCQDAHHCVKCKAGQLYLQDDKCVAECKRGYPDDGVCRSCAAGCASCDGETKNCLSCEEDYLRIKHTCVQDCPPKHFVKDGACERCPGGCAECDHTRTCGECLEYYFLHEGGCHDDCPEGFFTNVQQKRCEPCHTDCAACDGPDPDDCISCKGSRALRYNGKCLNNCPSDTYLDETECRDCDRSCLMCSGPGPSSCLTCGTNMRKDVNGHCEFFSDCSPHMFVGSNGQCRRCHPSCLRCSGSGKDHCLACNAKHFLLNQTCVSTCPSGYYGDEERQECVHCHMNCASCSGHHSNDCLTCKASLFLLGHSCFSTCPPSFFVNSSSGVCQACDRTCEECSGSGGFCLSCRDGYLLFRKSGLCLHACPSHYFPDDDRECKRCHPTCKTCEGSGAIYCTSCYEGFGMLAGICSSDCLSGQYKTNDTCAYCDQSCNECKGPGPYNCTGCPALQRLSEDGRCLSCCGEDTHRHSSRFPWECCLCNELDDECDVRLNYNFFRKGPLPSVRPGVVVFTVIFVLVSLWFAIFSFLHFRRRTPSKPIVKSNGYAKIPDDPFTSATLKDSVQPEYCDKDEDQEDEDEDDDIVYMGRDGIVYRKFKYSMLEGEEPEEEAELEYDDGIHSYIKHHF